jgi:hypothetical protein
MENLIIERTSRTPTIHCNAATGEIQISGRSMPDNGTEFFKPFFEWLNEYAKDPQSNTSVDIWFEYFNTASSHNLINLFGKLQNIFDAGHNVAVRWFYADEDIMEHGEDYRQNYGYPFKIIDCDKWIGDSLI